MTATIAAAVADGAEKVTFGITSPDAVALKARNFFVLGGVTQGTSAPNLRIEGTLAAVPERTFKKPLPAPTPKLKQKPSVAGNQKAKPELGLSVAIAEKVREQLQKNAMSLPKGVGEIPREVQEVLYNKCLDCHDADSEKGGVNLDLAQVNWKNPDHYDHLHRALNAVDQGLMPPTNKPQLTEDEKRILADWLDKSLLANTEIGGQLPRRLSNS
ncbi:MAG: c-type cytochrome, partial [Verrucomicrobiota bacterium]